MEEKDKFRMRGKGFKRLSWSIMNKWLSCKRMFYYRYIGGFDAPSGLPLIVGSLFHLLIETQAQRIAEVQEEARQASQSTDFLNSFAHSFNFDLFVAKLQQEASEIVANWINEKTSEIPDGWLGKASFPYTADEVHDSGNLILGQFCNWIKLHTKNDLLNYEIIEIEPILWDIPILKPDGSPQSGWKLVGRVDLILRDRHSGNYLLREYKTTGLSDARDLERKVDLDPQVRLYAHAVSRVLWPDGSNRIKQVQYAVIRKKLPSVPTMVKGKKKTDPELVPSRSRSVDSTRDVVEEFLRNKGFDPAEYTDLLEGLPPWEKFINLSTHWLEQEDLTEASREAWKVTKEISSSIREYRKTGDMYQAFPRNTGQCTGPTGFCAYRSICASRIKAEDVPLGEAHSSFQLRPDHPELED